MTGNPMSRPSDITESDSGAGSSMLEPGLPAGGEWISEQVSAMARAWDRGERVSAREIMSRFPDLPSEAAIRLIYEEVCLHREAGLASGGPTKSCRRHPQWTDKLQAMLDCDRLLRPPESVVSYPTVGEVLGPFLLLALLGRGSSGLTFLATDPTLANRPVVVKVVPDDQEEHLALC